MGNTSERFSIKRNIAKNLRESRTHHQSRYQRVYVYIIREIVYFQQNMRIKVKFFTLSRFFPRTLGEYSRLMSVLIIIALSKVNRSNPNTLCVFSFGTWHRDASRDQFWIPAHGTRHREWRT